ncbi:hypothetical protein, partial [Paraburkholderia humisilvae]
MQCSNSGLYGCADKSPGRLNSVLSKRTMAGLSGGRALAITHKSDAKPGARYVSCASEMAGKRQ